jgi:hypothetical protein
MLQAADIDGGAGVVRPLLDPDARHAEENVGVTAALGVAALCGWISCANTPTAPTFIKAIVDTPSSSARASRQATHDTPTRTDC